MNKTRGAIGAVRETVTKKQEYAERLFNLPEYETVPWSKKSEWKRKRELLLEIQEQILICEELSTPLSEKDIDELCEMNNLRKIMNYCRNVKLA